MKPRSIEEFNDLTRIASTGHAYRTIVDIECPFCHKVTRMTVLSGSRHNLFYGPGTLTLACKHRIPKANGTQVDRLG